jgi:hypothetical protein
MSSWREIITTAMFMHFESWSDVEDINVSLVTDWRGIGFEELKDLSFNELLDEKYLLYNSVTVYYPPPLTIFIWTKARVYFSTQVNSGFESDDWTIKSVPRNPF